MRPRRSYVRSHHSIGWTLDRDGEPDVEVNYSYLPGQPATGPTYSSGGDPPCDPEVEILSATGPDGVPIELTYAEEQAVAQWVIENPPEDDDPNG